MTPEQLRAARQTLGLSAAELAALAGFTDAAGVDALERPDRSVNPRVARLMQAYLTGYRPAGWPSQPTPPMIPDELRDARKRLGLTGAQLASAMGYTDRKAIVHIENGKTQPSAGAVPLLRAFLDGYRPPDWPA